MENSKFQLTQKTPEEIFIGSYDLIVFALGFENRSSKLLSMFNGVSRRQIAFGFDYGQELSYEANCEKFSAKNVELIKNLTDSAFQDEFESQLTTIAEGCITTGSIKILIDVSCFNRNRLASIIYNIARLSENREVVVDFFYSIAKFTPPPKVRTPNSIVDAVHPKFAGWSRVPADHTAAIIGFGYEHDQALGAIEYLQANPVWAFSPSSAETRYISAVEKANRLLIDELPKKNIVQYLVEDPLSTFIEIDGLIRGLTQDYNVVLIPFGPKIFVLLSLLAAWRNPSVAVWRVSPGKMIRPSQKECSNTFSTLRLTSVRSLG